MAADSDPTVHRRRLRTALRRAREGAGFTQREVARDMEWSVSKLIRIETGGVPVSTNDLRALLSLYRIPDRVDLIEMARAGRSRSPWSDFNPVATPEYVAFCGYESSASVIRNFEPSTIPGLLQTEEYARVIIQSSEPNRAPQEIEKLVQLRMLRQDILSRSDPPPLHFALDEAVIHRVIGGPDVMRRQLAHLLETSRLAHVTVRIVPFMVGIYPLRRVQYVLFEFPDENDEDVLYIENPQGQFLFREDSPGEDVVPASYLEAFFELEQVAPKQDAAAMVQSAIERLGGLTD
jgi:transcriptional regulator with XRE-family HTH domain